MKLRSVSNHALVRVDRVAHRLERVEGDSDRQNDLREEPVLGYPDQTQHRVRIGNRIGNCKLIAK